MTRSQVPQLSRRALLSVGGVTLLAAAPATSAQARTAPPAPGSAPTTPGTSSAGTSPPEELRGDSHPDGAGAGASSPETEGVVRHDRPQFYTHKGPGAIALTIDDGPDPRYTPQILALLERHAITATFCQIGEQAHRHPGLVREVAARGHLIANHTWTHADLALADPARIREEITRTSASLHRITGHRPHFFRAPYGAWSGQVLAECRALGLQPLDWSVDPRDWSRPGTEHIVRTILRTTHTGSIILEHDGGGDRSETVAALRIVLPRLLDHGYHFVTP